MENNVNLGGKSNKSIVKWTRELLGTRLFVSFNMHIGMARLSLVILSIPGEGGAEDGQQTHISKLLFG